MADNSSILNVSTAVSDVSTAINIFTRTFDEFVKIEKEKNELLRDIKNKLSDIAVIQALHEGSGCYVVRAESESESGLRGRTCFANGRLPREGNRGYYYYRDDLKVEP